MPRASRGSAALIGALLVALIVVIGLAMAASGPPLPGGAGWLGAPGATTTTPAGENALVIDENTEFRTTKLFDWAMGGYVPVAVKVDNVIRVDTRGLDVLIASVKNDKIRNPRALDFEVRVKCDAQSAQLHAGFGPKTRLLGVYYECSGGGMTAGASVLGVFRTVTWTPQPGAWYTIHVEVRPSDAGDAAIVSVRVEDDYGNAVASVQGAVVAYQDFAYILSGVGDRWGSYFGVAGYTRGGAVEIDYIKVVGS